MRLLFIYLSILVFWKSPGFSQTKDSISLNELETRIERLIEVNNIPSIGLALIDKKGNQYTRSFGFANLERQELATDSSMFRLGSISKMFVALAILQLRDQGKLSLQDQLSEIVPDVEFNNKWEESYPVRIQHLLNHTTGWDDIHGIEWMTNDPNPWTTKQAIDLHPHTRASRWPPGTRMSYSNAGAPVAAYVVEKVSGVPYEQYIEENFFEPIGLENTTFFNSETFQSLGVTNYHKKEALDYYNLTSRASGSLNSSPKEIVKLLLFFLNRGNLDSLEIISSQSIYDMENTYPDFGMMSGYGLCNFSKTYNGLEFRGHNGAIDNALATFYYQPENNIGFSLMSSTIESGDFRKINELIANYLTQGLTKESKNVEPKPEFHNTEIEGYYYVANPRNQKFRVIQNLFEPVKVHWLNDTLSFSSAFGNSLQKYVPTEKNRYASVVNTANGVTFMPDFDGSMILYKSVSGSTYSYKPISTIMVFGRLAVFILAVVLSLITLLIGVVWFIQFLIGNLYIQSKWALIIGPMTGSATFLPSIILFLYLLNHPFDLLFVKNTPTMILYVLTLVYGVAGVWTIITIGRNLTKIWGDALNVYLATVGFIQVLMTIYFLSMGLIGLQTWS